MTELLPEDFPILCETCLGENPYLRMTREKHGKPCKICDRPFSIFRWRPGPHARYKKTEVCPTCAKLKNVCQTCILDLQYGLPVQVRDVALEEHEKMAMPVSTTNRDYLYEQIEQRTGMGREGGLQLPYDKVRPNSMLQHLRRRGPYYRRNLPHICSFFVKGECTRGVNCPYRHTMPQTGELADQNIKDRFYGVNDPVARKLLRRHEEINDTHRELTKQGPPLPPTDPTVRTLFIGGIDHSISEDHIRQVFMEYGTVSTVTLLLEKKCGFVSFMNRTHAELAMSSLFDCLVISGKRLKLDWGKSKNAPLNRNAPIDPSKIPAPPGMGGNTLSKQDIDYLHNLGINPPSLPPMPDPVLVPPPPGMPNQTRTYQTMNTNYGEAQFNTQL